MRPQKLCFLLQLCLLCHAVPCRDGWLLLLLLLLR
jgi:hypothetical protein